MMRLSGIVLPNLIMPTKIDTLLISKKSKNSMNIEQARDKIRQSPSFPKLRKATISFWKSLNAWSCRKDLTSYQIKELADEDVTPESFLIAHAGVMNYKSARAQTLLRLANEVFAQTGLPRNPPGKFRGENGLDKRKLEKSPENLYGIDPANSPEKGIILWI